MTERASGEYSGSLPFKKDVLVEPSDYRPLMGKATLIHKLWTVRSLPAVLLSETSMCDGWTLNLDTDPLLDQC
jgi:hypothetical protein